MAAGAVMVVLECLMSDMTVRSVTFMSMLWWICGSQGAIEHVINIICQMPKHINDKHLWIIVKQRKIKIMRTKSWRVCWFVELILLQYKNNVLYICIFLRSHSLYHYAWQEKCNIKINFCTFHHKTYILEMPVSFAIQNEEDSRSRRKIVHKWAMRTRSHRYYGMSSKQQYISTYILSLVCIFTGPSANSGVCDMGNILYSIWTFHSTDLERLLSNNITDRPPTFIMTSWAFLYWKRTRIRSIFIQFGASTT